MAKDKEGVPAAVGAVTGFVVAKDTLVVVAKDTLVVVAEDTLVVVAKDTFVRTGAVAAEDISEVAPVGAGAWRVGGADTRSDWRSLILLSIHFLPSSGLMLCTTFLDK